MTPEEFDRRLESQRGLCAVCKTNTAVHVDHDEDRPDKKVRGILCFDCNASLGKFRHDPTLLREAANYVEWHKNNDGDESLRSQPSPSLSC